MKKIVYILSLILITASFNTSVFAGENPKEKSRITLDGIEKNLLSGVKSENSGLKTSSAYFLGEIKSENAVIPLMGMLHNEIDEGNRLMAALSLFKIGTQKSIYAVKQAAKFDKSERVRRICALFYNVYRFEKSAEKNLELASLN